ncbi:PLC-like phosphodiesterase [Clavulina sp. PMI_390]|nr:PLC-like phosphodiesterase [Clavulina sp. PMI_390]
MSLQSSWLTSLPGCGYEVTSTLVSGTNVYAACNGYVYLLDSTTGKVVHENGLSGRGNNEVRLDISDDGSTLIVGTDGYVLGLNSSTLGTNWQTSLPGCGYNLVNVLTAGGGATGFAACNGYVYSFNISNGSIQHKNSLSGRGDHETRLALTLAADVLLVGIDGYALGLSPSSLGTNWQTSLPGCGYAVTSVAGGEGCCYAACNGYLYMLDASKGGVSHENNMSGTGLNEGRLALRKDAGALFIGINGYALAVKTSDISTIYKTSLPDCGFATTNVVSGDLFTYYACNGYVFSLDEGGNVKGRNTLPGLGLHETRLAIDTEAEEHVFAGINGYSAGLVPVPPPQSGPWMTANSAALGPKMLRQIAIPGTHDSGTYAMNALSAVGADLPWYVNFIEALPLPAIVIKEIIALWSIAQCDNFFTQLKAGVRYLDLRVQGGGSLNFVHGLQSAPVSDLMSQLSTFLSISGYEKEVVILDFNHFYSMSGPDHTSLINLLKSTFPNSLAIYNASGSNTASSGFNANVTFNDLWNSSARIIVFYRDDPSVADNNILWPNYDSKLGPAITSPWPDKSDFADIKTALDGELPYTGVIPFVLQCQVTPDKTDIALGIAGGTYDSLGAFAEGGNPLIIQWLNGWGNNVGINIVIADWITQYPTLISTILGMDGITIPATVSEVGANAAPATTSNGVFTPDDLIKGLKDGTIKLADVISRTHARSFHVFGREPSKENVKALMQLQEFVEGSEVGQSKLSRKPAVVHDPAKLEKKMGEMKM